MTWETQTIGNLVDRGAAHIQTGPFGTQLKASDYVDEGTPVINVRNIGFGGLTAQRLEFVNEETAERLASHLLEQRDIVFGRKGAVDRHLFVREEQEHWIQGSDCIRLRFLTEDVVSRFVSYSFLTQAHQKWMLAQSGNKATMASLNHDVIKRISFGMPKPAVQRKIADVLSAYDDLIENNGRRMALLEEAARELYREWFVRLRFPGHEHTPITDGVPEGWERRRIRDIADCVGGGTPSTRVSAFWEDGDVTWVTPTDVTRNKHFILLDSETKITEAGLRNSSAKLVPPHAVLMTSRASVGFFAITGREVCTNQGFISVVPREPSLAPYLLFHLSDRVEEIRAMGSGSTYPEVSRGKFREFEVRIPRDLLISAFDEQATQILNQIRILKQQIARLRAARDVLLPRLMSGQIAV
jgi:type I restriction enzyme S subunit